MKPLKYFAFFLINALVATAFFFLMIYPSCCPYYDGHNLITNAITNWYDYFETGNIPPVSATQYSMTLRWALLSDKPSGIIMYTLGHLGLLLSVYFNFKILFKSLNSLKSLISSAIIILLFSLSVGELGFVILDKIKQYPIHQNIKSKLISDWNLTSFYVNMEDAMSSNVELKNVSGLNKTLTTLSIKDNGVFTFNSQSETAQKKYIDIYFPFDYSTGVWQFHKNILKLKFTPDAAINPQKAINDGFEYSKGAVIIEFMLIEDPSIDRLSLKCISSSYGTKGVNIGNMKYLSGCKMNFASYDFEQIF
mgnify:CR=1 FL=1|jgi:hypothetical protein